MYKNITILSFAVIAFLALAGNADARTISTCSSATLKGSVSSTRDNPTTVWFEWGEGRRENSDVYNNATQSQVLTRSGSFSEILTGLSPRTTYYYMAVAQNRDGVTVGDIETFTTASCSGNTASSTQVIVKEVPVIRTVYVPAKTTQSVSTNTQSYRTIPIASSNTSTNQNYSQPNITANVAGISSSFSFAQILLFLIFLFLIALLVKRIFLAR